MRSKTSLGTQIRNEYLAGLHAVPNSTETRRTDGYSYPSPDNEDYFEWIDLLESVVEASQTYTMIDLGAGFGRWAVRALMAAERYNPKLRCHVVAVEAEPQMFEWMKAHFRHNGIKPRWHKLVHGAMSEEPGRVPFCIGGPKGGEYDRPLNAWYGQFMAKGNPAFGESREDGRYCGFKVHLHKSGWRSIDVPSVRLRSLLDETKLVDLIDLDIEGEELAVLSKAIDELDAKVKRIHIGTHGAEIEVGLRRLFNDHGWHCKLDYANGSTSETPWGPIHFENGIQTWINPRL